MITRTMTAKAARDNFTDLLGAVYYGKEPIIVERKGRAFAVVINPQEYQRYQKMAKEQFFKTAKQVRAKNKLVDENSVLADVTQVVEKVREERYDNH